MISEKIQRTFIIGDEWLYYKFYCGPKSADRILTEVVKPAAEQLLQKGIIDRCFFIRYSDPDLHLRVRFHYTKAENIYPITDIVNKLSKFFIDNNLMWQVQIDSYQRELERYGKRTMEASEELFFHESMMLTNMLELSENYDDPERARWLFSLKALDTLFTDFGYNITQKLEIATAIAENFGEEHGMDHSLRSQLGKKFRKERSAITEVLGENRESEYDDLFRLVDYKSYSTKSVVNYILEHRDNNTLEMELNNLLASYAHMLFNRIFRDRQRYHEMVLYNLLYLYYKGEVAKERSVAKKAANKRKVKTAILAE